MNQICTCNCMENKVNNIIEGVSNYRYNISFCKKIIWLFVYQFTVIALVYVSLINYIKGYFYMKRLGRKTRKTFRFQFQNNNDNNNNKEQK